MIKVNISSVSNATTYQLGQPAAPPVMDAASREHRRRRSSVTDIGGPQPARAGRSTRSPTLPRASVGELSEEGHKSRQDELPRSGGSSPPTSDHVELEDLLSDGLEDDEETGLASEDRRKRRQQKRRNTLLDARVAGDGKLSKLQQTMASQSVLQKSIINAILIGLWCVPQRHIPTSCQPR